MSKRTGRKPKRERTSRRRTRRHSSTSETSSEDVPPPPKVGKTRASSRVEEGERKVALTIKLPKPESNDCSEENTTGMWKVECSNGSDGDIQKLKISLRRSPKDLLREQAAEAKYSAERKEKEAASTSTNPSILDGSVTNYLEQFCSTVAVEESEQNIVDSSEQVQVVIPPNEPSCNQENIDDDQIDNVEVSSEFITPDKEPIVENISTDEQLNDAVVSEIKVEEKEIHEEVLEPAAITVESINPTNSSKDFIDSTVRPSIDECDVSEPALKESCITIGEVIDIPIAISEDIQDIVPESIESVVNEPEVSETASNVDINKIDNNPIQEEFNKPDYINDSEQMEDVVQLTVESPDLVDDEDPKPIEEETKLVDREEPKQVYEEESNSVNVNETESDNEIELKPVNEDESKLVVRQETTPIEESYKVLSSDIHNIKQVDDEKELNESPKLLSSHPKRKWGSCKTRTPITISPFTLGTIIESNGDSIADNGEYRSEEGEIQRTDSDDDQDVEEAMEMNDTMLIDHEAVDYEAPEEEEKPFIDNDDNKSDRSLAEEINELETKKKSVKRITTTSVIRITNLVRPFTLGQLRDLLQRTGKIVPSGFWMDTIKSQCIVEYENEDQAIETVYALNDSQWPSTNPKFLRVVFTNKEELNKALSGTHPDRLDKQKESKVEKLRTRVENHFILREWDRGKLEDMNGEDEKDEKPMKRKISYDLHVIKDKKIKKDEKDLQDKRKKSKSKTPDRIPTKSLDELFRKTKTTPTLYWSPLSIEQIAEKEDQRRKHLAEIERSQKTDRRRRDNLHYPKRR